MSPGYPWRPEPGLLLARRYLERTPVEVVDTPLTELPQLSRRVIALALRIAPSYLDRTDLSVPSIVAGRGPTEIALDGRHRLSKAIWTGRSSLPTVRVPWRYALELIVPGPFEAEWLYLRLRRALRRVSRSRRSSARRSA